MVKHLVDGVEKYIKKFIFDSDVFLIFDRYKADSIKSDSRSARIGSFQRSCQLSLDRELPLMCLCLSSTSTKENLIEIISGELFERFAANACSTRRVITSKNEVPEEVHCGVRIQRHDLASNFDEVDYIIAQQVNSTVRQREKQVINAVSADTDVFVLLCSNLAKNNWYSANLYMDTFTEDNKLININKSVHNNKETIPSLIAMHALSGCDLVPMMFGIGKAKALKALKNVPLKSIGNINADLEEVMNEGFKFVANC